MIFPMGSSKYLYPGSVFLLGVMALAACGCATLFGWDIHAPGLVSQEFYQTVQPADQTVALYLRPELFQYQSKNRGGRFADPQTYYIGESLGPILIEAFQQGFHHFLFLETEPTPDLLKQEGIDYLIFVDLKNFDNAVSLKGQKVGLMLHAEAYTPEMNLLAAMEVEGTNDAYKVFARKGGPEVNLNAAIESAVTSLVLYLQDAMRTQQWTTA